MNTVKAFKCSCGQLFEDVNDAIRCELVHDTIKDDDLVKFKNLLSFVKFLKKICEENSNIEPYATRLKVAEEDLYNFEKEHGIVE